MTYLARSGAQALKIAAGATSGTITGLLIGLSGAVVGDTLKIPAPSTAIRTASLDVGSGAFTLPAEFPWPGKATYSTVTISNANPAVVTWADHGLLENTPVVLETTGAVPTGLAVATVYWTKNVASGTFQLSATPGGAAIATTTAGSGTHTAARADWQIDFDSGRRKSNLYNATTLAEVNARLAQGAAQAIVWRCSDVGNTLPASPAEFQTFGIGTAPTGEAVTHGNKLAYYLNGAWAFIPPLIGDVRVNAAGQVMAIWNGTTWSVNADVAGAASSVDGEVALFDGTTGKKIKSAGVGVPAGGFVGRTASQTLTNKTLTTPVLDAPAYTNVGGTATKTGAYTLVASDHRKTIYLGGSANYTVATDDPANLGGNWCVTLKATANIIVTLDPFGTSTVDGASTMALFRGQEVLLSCDGGNFHTFGLQKEVLIYKDAKTNVPQVDLDLPPGYNGHRIILNGLIPVVGTPNLRFRFRTLGGSFRTGGSDYADSGMEVRTNSAIGGGASSTTASIFGQSTLNPNGTDVVIHVSQARVAGRKTQMLMNVAGDIWGTAYATRQGSGLVNTAEQNDQIRVFMENASNLTIPDVAVFGIV